MVAVLDVLLRDTKIIESDKSPPECPAPPNPSNTIFVLPSDLGNGFQENGFPRNFRFENPLNRANPIIAVANKQNAIKIIRASTTLVRRRRFIRLKSRDGLESRVSFLCMP